MTVGALAVILLAAALSFGIDFSMALPLAVLLSLTGEPFVDLLTNAQKRDLFAPTTLVAAYFIIYFAARAVCVYFDTGTRLGYFPYDDYLPAALWCACLGYASFVAGFRCNFANGSIQKFSAARLAWPRLLPRFRSVLLIGIASAGLAYLFSIGFVVGEIGQNRAAEGSPKFLPIYLAGLLDLVWIAIWIELLSRQSRLRRGAAWFLLLLTIASLGARVAMFGTKVMLIGPLLELMIVFHYLKRRLRFWQLIGIALPTAFAAFGLLNFYRFVVVGQVAGSPTSVNDVSNRISAASEYLNHSAKNGSTGPSALEQMMNRSTGVDSLALIIKYTPDPNPFAYGRDLLELPISFIPRQLWAGKPVQTGGSYFEINYEGLPPSFNASTSIQLIADLYRNFYLFGVIGGMFLFGLLLRFIYKCCLPYKANAAGVFFYAVFLPGIVHCLEQTAAATIMSIIVSSLLVIATGAFLGVRLQNRNPRYISSPKALLSARSSVPGL